MSGQKLKLHARVHLFLGDVEMWRRSFFLAVISGMLSATGCVSSRTQHFLDKSIEAGALPKQGVGFAGISVWFEELPEDFIWEIQLRLKNKEGQEVVLTAPGQALVAGKKADRAPIVFSLSPGEYEFVDAALNFPKTKDDLYNVAEERLPLSVSKPLPRLAFQEGRIVVLGEIKIDKAVFIPGKRGHSTRLHVVWNPRAALMGSAWAGVRRELPIYDLASLEAGQTNEPSGLLYDQTSDTALATFLSGFSDAYSLVVAGSDRPGFAFFDDGTGKVLRVQGRKMGDVHAFLLPVNRQERVSLRGFCFHESDPEKCPRESSTLGRLPNARDFVPGELRYRGYFASDAGGKIVAHDELVPAFEQAFHGEAPFAAFRSFALGEEIRRKVEISYVFFNDKGEKEKWDPISFPLIQRFSKTAASCDSKLREIDPFVSANYEFAFDRVGSNGRFELILSSVKGLLGPAVEVLKPCLDAELHTWQGIEGSEVAEGFGVRFK